MTSRSRLRNKFFAAVGSALVWCSPVVANAAQSTEADLDRAFAAVIANPANLDASFEYARIAAELGDYEAAISSLERMLIYNPKLPRVHVELGVLYFRLQSYEAARSYFQQALAFPDVPEVVQQRVKQFLDQIDKATSKHLFAFSVSGGLRYQSNANSASGNNVLVIDLPAVLGPQFQRKSDTNVFASARMRHLYNFGGQRGDALETNVNLYGSRQFEVDDLDIALVSVNTGPILTIAPASGIKVRPYILGSFLALSAEPYQGTLGVGGTISIPLSRMATLDAEVRAQTSDYYDSDVRPTASNLDGQEIFGEIGVGLLPRSNIRVRAAVSGRKVDASADFQSYDEFGVSLTASVDVPAPVSFTKEASSWTLSLDARGFTRGYDAANPIVSATVRDEDEIRADAQIYAPITGTVGVFAGLGWRDVGSNLPNYRIENFSVMGGLSARF